MTSLSDSVTGGDRRALARLITQIENDPEAARSTLGALFPMTGRAVLTGVTGSPGTGKSSLVNKIALALRQRGQTVAILAVDPSSPFTGGALLGDRVRMRELTGDTGIFIRSMASRGSLGGLAGASYDTIRALDAAGFDHILIETVGAGQGEIEIARQAQTVIVVEAPGMGDDIQAIKAGILEIADILVVNKCDDPRAASTASGLKAVIEMAGPAARKYALSHHSRWFEANDAQEIPEPDGQWPVPVLLSSALTGEGVDAIVSAMDDHQAYLRQSGENGRRERQRLMAEISQLTSDALMARLMATTGVSLIEGLVDGIMSRRLDVHQAVATLLSEFDPAGCRESKGEGN